MDAASEVKRRLSIEDVVSEYVQLKRTGRNFKGLSPWTNEKTPSFIVSPEKQIWHDFSSGKGGDMFSFVMEMEGLDFKGALELLARKAGVELEQFRGQTNGTGAKLKSRSLEALELAARFYQKQLTANKAALEYLIKQRGFSKKTILDWRLGYSPNVGHALSDFLTKHGFSVDEMNRAGLTVTRSGRAADMFRGRIMIPLCDPNGAVIGFTARLLADQPDAPKYINTPATIVYDKSRHIYGLHLAKEAIRKTKFVVVAEGNLDVIASHQVGISNVVASAGTAMTEAHLKVLKRFSGDVRLSFDADRAGLAAAERVIPLAQKAGVQLRIISIKDAKDPDELVKKDPKLWTKAIDQASYAPDWLIERYQTENDLTTAAGKRSFTDNLLVTIRSLSDPIEQEHYLKLIAKLTDSTLEAVRAKFVNASPEKQILKRPKLEKMVLDKELIEYQRLQDHFLAMCLMQPKLRTYINTRQSEFFEDGPRRQVFEFLINHPDFKGDIKEAKALQNISDYVKIIGLQFEELYQDLPLADLEEQAAHLKHRLIDRYVKIQKRELAKTMQETHDEQKLEKLMKRANELNALLHSKPTANK